MFILDMPDYHITMVTVAEAGVIDITRIGKTTAYILYN